MSSNLGELPIGQTPKITSSPSSAVENSGVLNLIEFKRSVIENKEINEAQVGYVCQVIQYLIEAKLR